MNLIAKTRIFTLYAITLLFLCPTVMAADSARQWADAIIEDAGLTGGVIVYLGNNVERAAALNVSDKFIVQCLTTQKNSSELQKIRSSMGTGSLSFLSWKGGRLPFANNMINIMIRDSKDSLPTAERDRVLAPRGVFIDLTKDKGRYTKPVPKAIDSERIRSVKENERDYRKKAPRAREVIQTGWKSRGELMTAKEATALTYQWSKDDPGCQVRAMALTKNALLTAGIPDYVNEVSFWEGLKQKSANNAGLTKQQEAWEGKHGGYLRVVSRSNGNQKASYKLEAPPVFDGLIVAQNQIYISLMSGKVVCFQNK